MVRQVYIVQKMSPTHRIKMKYKIGDFTKFVNFFSWSQRAKMAAFEKSKLKSAIEIFYLQNPSNKTNWKLFTILKQHVYAGN